MNKEEESIIDSQKNTPETPKTTQEEIDKELDSQAMKINQTVEEYNAEKEERLGIIKKEENQTSNEIESVQNEIKNTIAIEACEKDLLNHLNSQNVNWNSVEGRINSMLSEVQKIDQSEEVFKINTKISEHITEWLKNNLGKYDNQILAQEAIKHAFKNTEDNYAKLPNIKEEEENKEKSKAEQIKDFFKEMAGGVEKGTKAKTIEYDQRIRDIIAKNPKDPRLKSALEDFKQWTREDWTEDFKPE